MSENKKILVIGAGPSAYVTALTCLEYKCSVAVANPNLNQWKDISNSTLLEKIILKKRFAFNDNYKVPSEIIKFHSKKIDLYENFNAGGLSNLWGGVFLPPNMAEFEFGTKLKNEFLDAISYIEGIVPLQNREGAIYQTLLMGERRSISIEEAATIAIDTIDEEIHWSGSILENKPEFEKVRFIDAFVESLAQMPNGQVQVKFISDSKNYHFESFDKVFIGAGVFGTARILLNSLASHTSFVVLDSGVTTCLALKFNSKSSKKLDLRMVPDTLYINKSDDGKTKGYAQTYKMSTELIESFKYKKMHKLIAKIIAVLNLNLRLVMFFHQTDESPKIILFKKNQDLIAKSLREKYHFKNILKIALFFLKTRYVPVSPLIKLRPGAGVHSGGFIKVNALDHKGTIDSDLANWHNVHVVGSATSPIIPTGPIMLTLMANSRVIALNSLKDI